MRLCSRFFEGFARSYADDLFTRFPEHETRS